MNREPPHTADPEINRRNKRLRPPKSYIIAQNYNTFKKFRETLYSK
jgi:hypothetical protein